MVRQIVRMLRFAKHILTLMAEGASHVCQGNSPGPVLSEFVWPFVTVRLHPPSWPQLHIDPFPYCLCAVQTADGRTKNDRESVFSYLLKRSTVWSLPWAVPLVFGSPGTGTERPILWPRQIRPRRQTQIPCIRPSTSQAPVAWKQRWRSVSFRLMLTVRSWIIALTYATGGISARSPVNIVTSVSMQVTSRVTRPGMASRPNQKLNQESITTSEEGANVCIRWCPICRSNRK